ncbi:hypothetical protein AB0F17_65830 [Nonomuraea sp. NPDC026600]|uniref:hypothetical protein n=1 Tax=Nonomuraea sp. NPDC026600 TaxID=3155363 RepID=UPI0033D58A36
MSEVDPPLFPYRPRPGPAADDPPPSATHRASPVPPAPRPWYGPDPRRVDWRAAAPFAAGLAGCVLAGLLLALPSSDPPAPVELVTVTSNRTSTTTPAPSRPPPSAAASSLPPSPRGRAEPSKRHELHRAAPPRRRHSRPSPAQPPEPPRRRVTVHPPRPAERRQTTPRPRRSTPTTIGRSCDQLFPRGDLRNTVCHRWYG